MARLHLRRGPRAGGGSMVASRTLGLGRLFVAGAWHNLPAGGRSVLASHSWRGRVSACNSAALHVM